MRILHVIASLAPRYGGPSKACLDLCCELARRGEEVAIYTTNIDGEGEIDVPLGRPVWQDSVEIRYFPIQTPRSYAFSGPLARALRSAIPKYDVVHIHSLYLFPSTAAAHYARRFDVPYLVLPHGTLDPYLFRRHRWRKWVYERLFEWRNLNRAAAIHFASAEELELTRPLGLEAPGIVVPFGLDLRDYEAAGPAGAFRTAWPETGDRKIVLFLSRLNFKKGLDVLARAFGEVARAREDAHLVLAGPDNEGYAQTVRGWLEAEGALARSTFTGMLLGREKLVAFRDADLFVLPSYTENFGIAVVEAMACGLPVVITDRVNIWREIAEVRAGLVVRCDAREVADAILALLKDPGLRREMGERGRRLVAERFTWEAAGDRMLEVYRAVGSRSAPPLREGVPARGGPG